MLYECCWSVRLLSCCMIVAALCNCCHIVWIFRSVRFLSCWIIVARLCDSLWFCMILAGLWDCSYTVWMLLVCSTVVGMSCCYRIVIELRYYVITTERRDYFLMFCDCYRAVLLPWCSEIALSISMIIVMLCDVLLKSCCVIGVVVSKILRLILCSVTLVAWRCTLIVRWSSMWGRL